MRNSFLSALPLPPSDGSLHRPRGREQASPFPTRHKPIPPFLPFPTLATVCKPARSETETPVSSIRKEASPCQPNRNSKTASLNLEGENQTLNDKLDSILDIAIANGDSDDEEPDPEDTSDEDLSDDSDDELSIDLSDDDEDEPDADPDFDDGEDEPYRY